jgi:hypothetical protein
MIEQAMIFTLGFLLAGILALVVAPAFWRRAVRLARRRIEAQVPVSIAEILAERDLLRAQNAVECRRLEDRVAALNRRHAADLSEISGQAAEIAGFRADLAAREHEQAAAIAENAQLMRELFETSATSAAAQKALFDADAAYRNRSDEVVDINQSLSAVSALAEVRLASLSAADNYARDLERHLDVMRADLATLQTRLKDKTRETGESKDVLAIARSDLAKAQKKLESESARAADLEAAANALRLARKNDAAELRSLNRKLETGLAELDDWRGRDAVRLAKDSGKAQKLRESEGLFAKQLHVLQSDNAALRGALEVARRHCDELERELTSMRRGEAARPAAAGANGENGLPRKRSLPKVDPRELAAPSGPTQVGEQSKSGLGPDEAQTSGGLQNRVEG